MPLNRALLILAFLYFGPFLFIGSLVCPGTAQGLGEVEPSAILSLVPSGEPGEALWVTGQVFDGVGKVPLSQVEFRVYQTDAEGYYREGTTSSANPKLQGVVKTDTNGRFEIRTIRPGSYPGRGVPAHIHFVFSREGFQDLRFELQFEGDPYLRPAAVEKSRKEGAFGAIQRVRRGADGILRCSRDFRLRF